MSSALASDPPHPVAERIGALDVLRGIALLSMFLVHFHYYVGGPGDSPRLSSVYDWIATNLLEEPPTSVQTLTTTE